MRLLTDRTKRHGTSVEALHNFLSRLHVFDGNRLRIKLEFEKTAQIRPPLALIIHDLGELCIGLRVVRAAGMLQFIDRFRIPVMMLTLDAVVNLAAEIELANCRRLIRDAMTTQGLFANFSDADPFHTRRSAGEVAIDQFAIQSDCLENLRPAVGLHGGDPHLREDLEESFVDGLNKFPFRRLRIKPFRQVVVPLHVDERFENQIRIDGSGPIPDQTGKLMHIARLAGFEDQAHFGSRTLTNEVVVDGRNTKQAWNRRPLLIDSPVAQDQELVALLDGLRGLLAQVVDCLTKPIRPFGNAEQHPKCLALEVRVGNPTDLLQIGVRENRLLHLDPPAGLRGFIH